MNIDLFHNKIIKDTVTDAFIDAVNTSLVPKLEEEYGAGLLGIQMYEDYLACNFVLDGEFYYPLTLVLDTGLAQRWIKWNVSKKSQFKLSPYSYKGDAMLNIELAASVPEKFVRKIAGRVFYFDGKGIPVTLQSTSSDKTFLAGKYSQSFIDAMSKSITEEIERETLVENIGESSISILMVFAPDTYMEHVIDNTTYRRLLISAKGCSARDLWIKWKRRDLAAPATISDDVLDTDIIFEIAEDVPQKLREREYRFLIKTSLEKYQSAMGRRNMTEWRELIKRMIKRGELVRLEATEPELKVDDINQKLLALLGENQAEPEPEDVVLADDINALLKAALAKSESESVYEPEELEEEPEEEIEELEEPEEELEEIEEEIEEPEEELEEIEEEIEEPEEELEEEPAPDYKLIEERMRREIEEKIRREYEEKLRESERLREEQERSLAKALIEKEERERKAKEAEAEKREELLERERIAEAARLALVEEQKRILREQEEMARREEEKLRLERETREAEERRLREEEERRRAEESKAAAAPATPQYTYTSKKVKLIFRKPVDPNVTKRIHEIILTTIKYYHKENVYMKIKATVPDLNTVRLDFVKVPNEEIQLIIDIINVLGRSNIGITKATLE